jgi:hypothetical protein
MTEDNNIVTICRENNSIGFIKIHKSDTVSSNKTKLYKATIIDNLKQLLYNNASRCKRKRELLKNKHKIYISMPSIEQSVHRFMHDVKKNIFILMQVQMMIRLIIAMKKRKLMKHYY